MGVNRPESVAEPYWGTGAVIKIMRKWELWETEGSSSFFPESNMQARLMAMEDGAVKVWEVEASSSNDAMRAMNEHLGWAHCQPMLRDDGTPFPEDEDDELLREL